MKEYMLFISFPEAVYWNRGFISDLITRIFLQLLRD